MQIVLIALLAFAALFSYGFATARNDLSKPEAVEAAVFGRSKFAKYDGDYVLVYPNESGKPTFIYDLDSLMVYPVGQPNPIKQILAEVDGRKLTFDPKTPIQILDLVSPAVVSTVGSVALGVSAKDLLTNPSMRTALRESFMDRRILVGICAAITGYSLGKFAANRLYVPSAGSPEVAKLIGNRALWYKNHAQLFAIAVFNAGVELQNIADEQVKDKAFSALNSSIKLVIEQFKQGEDKEKLPHLKSRDVRIVVESLEPFQAEIAKATKKATSWTNLLGAMLWLPLISLSFALILLGGTFAYSRFVESPKNLFPPIQHDK